MHVDRTFIASFMVLHPGKQMKGLQRIMETDNTSRPWSEYKPHTGWMQIRLHFTHDTQTQHQAHPHSHCNHKSGSTVWSCLKELFVCSLILLLEWILQLLKFPINVDTTLLPYYVLINTTATNCNPWAASYPQLILPAESLVYSLTLLMEWIPWLWSLTILMLLICHLF